MANGAICAIEKGLSKGAGSGHATPCWLAHFLQPSTGGQVWSPQQGGQAGCVCVGETRSFGLGRGKYLCILGQEGGLDLFRVGKVSALRRRLEKMRVEHLGASETCPGSIPEQCMKCAGFPWKKPKVGQESFSGNPVLRGCEGEGGLPQGHWAGVF